ncbi:uncharacterized protein PGTG_14492 [Puccinia graminis f. sp. tritici CRL 75-36-700-3]|uniref:Uncharacterized protein n=1 Tax=Puccinia graminis f. sp. tritici (strain CRL 75-36-700-3 / race SCCL) TaxID=418459 RepID=E3KVR8_PUCGT|nr:uncharacterized protein PGTG_14492 [Puccinia graminis f. sp. tritici CRL 75-36-700-3]EFP88408.2 hypothetical protein PGTG_14492 [Puccinia graminis f. sp. tritici CRL 75-36-700-3]
MALINLLTSLEDNIKQNKESHETVEDCKELASDQEKAFGIEILSWKKPTIESSWKAIQDSIIEYLKSINSEKYLVNVESLHEAFNYMKPSTRQIPTLTNYYGRLPKYTPTTTKSGSKPFLEKIKMLNNGLKILDKSALVWDGEIQQRFKFYQGAMV